MGRACVKFSMFVLSVRKSVSSFQFDGTCIIFVRFVLEAALASHSICCR